MHLKSGLRSIRYRNGSIHPLIYLRYSIWSIPIRCVDVVRHLSICACVRNYLHYITSGYWWNDAERRQRSVVRFLYSPSSRPILYVRNYEVNKTTVLMQHRSGPCLQRLLTNIVVQYSGTIQGLLIRHTYICTYLGSLG